MKGLAELSILFLLIVTPLRLENASGARLARYILVGTCAYWFILLFVAPRLPQ